MEDLSKRNKLKVLLVDDSALVTARVRTMLNDLKEFIVVGEAKDNKEAMMIIRVMNPDIVILDIKIPGRKGVEILKEIKQNYFRTKVIMFTNYVEPYYRDLCKESGADYFFDKSTEFEKVSEVLISLS